MEDTVFGVIEEEQECPQCGVPIIVKKCHVTGEESVACPYCGYSHEKTTSGKESRRGFGCIHYVKNGKQTTVKLDKPLTLLERHNIIMDLHENYDEASTFYVWNGKEVEVLVGHIPSNIDERYEMQRLEMEYEARMRYAREADDLL